MITGKPIKFIGTGENFTDIKRFYPDRMVSRILGMGDMLSLIDEIKHEYNEDKNIRSDKKDKKKQKFNLNDFKLQLNHMDKLGGINAILSKIRSHRLA